MKILKIISAMAITLGCVFFLSFLLDLDIIKQNWLRYVVVLALAFALAILGFAVTWQLIKELKDEK